MLLARIIASRWVIFKGADIRRGVQWIAVNVLNVGTT